ncbi:MAG: nucleoside deaminase [Betaproteobacteria bacterium]|nr:nucleoside deaminase [Betaproteobacteria bacterium]
MLKYAPALDQQLLRRAIELSRKSRGLGNHPFGAIVVDSSGAVLAEAMNDCRQGPLEHAEINAIRAALRGGAGRRLDEAILYSSAEPCAMCAGALYWSGIARLVYGLSERRLLKLTGRHPANLTLSLPCRDVLRRGQRPLEVVGPLLEDEAEEPHRGFWT